MVPTGQETDIREQMPSRYHLARGTICSQPREELLQAVSGESYSRLQALIGDQPPNAIQDRAELFRLGTMAKPQSPKKQEHVVLCPLVSANECPARRSINGRCVDLFG